MPVTHDRLYLSLAGVKSISVSDIELDEATGDYVRRISFFTEASPEVANVQPAIEVMLSGEQAALKVQTPTLSF